MDEKQNSLNDIEFDNITIGNDKNLFSKTVPFDIPADLTSPVKRINGLDSQLLDENSLKDDVFKPENRLNQLENKLKIIDEDIKFAEMVDNRVLVQDLHIERYKLVYEIASIKNAKRTYHFKGYAKYLLFWHRKIMAGKMSFQKKFMQKVVNPIFNILIKPIPNYSNLREMVSMLNSLNKNVEEISQLRIPYGEHDTRYEELTKYLTQVNSIQTLINKKMNERN